VRSFWGLDAPAQLYGDNMISKKAKEKERKNDKEWRELQDEIWFMHINSICPSCASEDIKTKFCFFRDHQKMECQDCGLEHKYIEPDAY